jgi:cytochrome c peroxidase
MFVRHRFALLATFVAALCAPISAALGLPPVPVPSENPITEPKRVLGKILFWEEQLSSDDSVACGTCHRPAFGGADPRVGRHRGTDPGTIDDVLGSPGIASFDAHDRPIEHKAFGFDAQVTPRAAPSNFGALWADELFWDGRAGQTVRDPETLEIVIERHGALEAQALATLLNDAEMAKRDRTWEELCAKLERSAPLALASDWPADVRSAIEGGRTYPRLFEAAFGDPRITPIRIAFALATYQRTLVADQTPWDRFQAGDAAALNEREVYGWRAFESLRCTSCHTPPLFTNDDFFNVGLRRSTYDPGRAGVTHDAEDAGEMKVPSLRNAGLRPRFMHTGQLGSLSEAIGFYTTSMPTAERDDIPGIGAYSFSMSAVMQGDLLEFLGNALTDPRVAEERFPFDRPQLRSERATRPDHEAR